jgi:hypothetical protein
MYEMKGALLCPQPVREIPLVTGTVVKVIHVLVHRLSTAGEECPLQPARWSIQPVITGSMEH